MSICKKCCKEFKYQWCLDRHLRRKIPCKKKVSNDTSMVSNDTSMVSNDTLQCKYCKKQFGRKVELRKHEDSSCKEKDDHVRCLEMQLGILYPENISNTGCRFCHSEFSQKSALTRHIKSCQLKQQYKETLEAKLAEKTKQQHPINQTINNQTINVVNISAETLRKFGEESTDHITNAYLRKVIGRLGITLPKVVSTVAKQIYCDDSIPDNKTIQITNVRSQWAKVSNGKYYELQPLGDSVKGVRDKVTDLYVERQCDEPEYFMKVNSRIDKLDDLNNQNYTAKTLEDKEDQKNASKLKSQIDREIKSTLYNSQKSRDLCIKM